MPPSLVRRHARWRPRVLPVLVAALAVLTGGGPVGAAPEPPLVVEAEGGDGTIRVEPATQQVDGPRVAWHLHNGGDATLTFTLALHEVEASSEGATIGEALGSPGLVADRITLAPHERARVPVHLADDGPRALALVATTVDATPETTVSGIALVGGEGAVRAEVVEADAAAGRFTLALDSSTPALVDVAIRATAWPGRPTTTHRLEGVLVPAGGREVPVRLDGPIVGRVTLEAAVTSGDQVERTIREVWWWPRWLLAAIAGLLVLVAAGIAVVVHRRRR